MPCVQQDICLFEKQKGTLSICIASYTGRIYIRAGQTIRAGILSAARWGKERAEPSSLANIAGGMLDVAIDGHHLPLRAKDMSEMKRCLIRP
jgi:hypothetical protein